MKTCSSRLILILLLAFWGVLSNAVGQTTLPDTGATKFQEEQFTRKWAAFSEKVESMTAKDLKANKASLEAEYNALVDELDLLFHGKPVVVPDKPQTRVVIGNVKAAAGETRTL